MGFSKIKGVLTSRIGRPVNFSAPKDVEAKGGAPGHGVIVDEVWAYPEVNNAPPKKDTTTDDWGDYSFCAQLIKLDSGEHYIRLAYYRRRAGENHWEYASQTTVMSEWRTMKTLLERTLAEKGWFKDEPEYPEKYLEDTKGNKI